MNSYPTVDEVITVHDQLIARFGGSLGIRDRGALESALARPQSGSYRNIIGYGITPRVAWICSARKPVFPQVRCSNFSLSRPRRATDSLTLAVHPPHKESQLYHDARARLPSKTGQFESWREGRTLMTIKADLRKLAITAEHTDALPHIRAQGVMRPSGDDRIARRNVLYVALTADLLLPLLARLPR